VRVHRLAWVLAALIATAAAACTPSRHEIVRTSTLTTTRTIDMRPAATGPTTSATTKRCPLIDRQVAADTVGMRLARVTVQHSGGKVVGCRIYALQNSPLAVSEKLPPANQPVIEVAFTQYRSAQAAHNAIVVAAGKGTNPQQDVFHGQKGVCFQIAFYKKDHGRDWSCAYSSGTTLVQVKTVVVTPALNAVLVTRRVSAP
jgi:hypothetical protein